MLPKSALRPFIFAKIHGIFSGFRNPEEWFSMLQSGSIDRALDNLPVPEKYRKHGSDQSAQEFHLHNALLGSFSDLAPAKGAAGLFFLTLFSEYEIKNISLFLKKKDAGTEDFYPLPRKTAPLSALLAGAEQGTGRKLLEATPYAAIAESWYADRDSTALDTALEKLYYKRLFLSALKLPGRDKKAILPILKTYIDLRSVLTVLRFHFLYNSNPETACRAAFFTDEKLKKQLLRTLRSGDIRDPLKLFPENCRERMRSRLREMPPDEENGGSAPDTASLENAGALSMQELFRRHFYKAHKSLGPLFCFYFLLKREILNTALLCNSIRLEIPAEEFRRELIY